MPHNKYALIGIGIVIGFVVLPRVAAAVAPKTVK